jgi:microcystin-dependent protein
MTTTALQFKYTAAGQLALFNAGLTGVELTFTHLQAGSGRRTPDGTERQLVTPQQTVTIAAGGQISTTQIRMAGIFTGDTSFPVSELGLWQGDPSRADSILVAYWSQPTGNLVVKSAGVDFVFSHDMVLAFDIPLGTIKVLVDPSQSVMLAALHRHEQAINPHPQYLTEDEVQSLIEARVGDYVVAGGTANAITVVLDPVVTAYTAKTAFTFLATLSNTGAVTINAGGGAKALLRVDGADMQPSDVQAGGVYAVVYDVASTSFRVTEVVASQIGKMLAKSAQQQAEVACTTTGTAPTYAATVTPAVAAYTRKLRLALTFHAGATAAPSLNVCGLGAKALKQYNSAGAKIAAVVAAGQEADVVFDGADFVVMNPLTPQAPQEVIAGMRMMWDSPLPPAGFLMENGTYYDPAVYVNLFNAIGYTYGKNYYGWFAVRDMRDRFPVGAGGRFANGVTGGVADSVVVAHAHGTSQTPHQHATSWGESWGGYYGNSGNHRPSQGSGHSDGDNYEYLTSAENANISINQAGESGTDKNLPPFSATYFIIKF